MITPVCLSVSHLSLSRTISKVSQTSKEDQSLLMEKQQEYTLGWQPSSGGKKKFFKTNRRRSRPKVPSVRLGGKKNQRRGIFSLVRLFRKMKLRWLKLQYSCLLKRLRSYYYSVVKDLIEAGATLQSVQQTIMMDSTYFAVPVMGVSMASLSLPFSRTGSNRVH